MEAKDTVLSYLKVSNQIPMTLLEFVAKLEEQAEISFPIGKQIGFEIGIEQGKAEGIREVVERIDKAGLIEHTDSSLHYVGATILGCPACCWYAHKKEWGFE